MVKLFPNSFSCVENQRLLNAASGEPVAIACSNEYLFVAEDDCLLEVFSLETLQPLGQFKTVSPVVELIYNAKGDCIITLERKNPASHGFARIYFKWRGASVDKPMRISLLHSLTHGILLPQDHPAPAEIIELPAELNSPVTCLACCEESGRIAIGMDTTLRIFTLNPDPELIKGGVSSDEGSGTSASDQSRDASHPHFATPSIGILLDIQTSLPLSKLSIFNDYVAFISTHEARVLKLSLLEDSDLQTASPPSVPVPEERVTPASDHSTSDQQAKSIEEDKDFVQWSPSRVWEEEKAASSLPASTSSSLVDISLPVLQRNKSHDSRGPSPIIGTLSLPSIFNSTSLKIADKHAIEVLGPVEYIWGQPIRVRIEDSENAAPTRCRVLTMLYRRFPPLKSVVSDKESSRSQTLSAKGRQEQVGLHTVQLLPVVTTDENGGRQLIGISCFLANKFHGYLYDVHLQGHLASSFSFMSPARAVLCDSTFIHVLSAESVETYTNRSLQTAILHTPSSHLDPSTTEWLRKPCPPPSVDLTLVCASQFVSSHCLASSPNHMVVITKGSEPSQSSASWLLQSLSIKKPAEPNWNIYILQKKDPIAMYQQFDELSSSLKDGSPPMYHHLLCEGHTLLRSQLVLDSSSLNQHNHSRLISLLRDNCLALAHSLCQYSSGKNDAISAAHYLVLSHSQIWSIITSIINKFPRKPSPPYTILLKFLDLVLFNKTYSDSSLGQGRADTVLDLYNEFKPQALPLLLLHSWLEDQFSPEKALSVIESYLQDTASLSVLQISLGRLCQLLVFLRLNNEQEAAGKLEQLSDSFLVEWLSSNLSFLVESNNSDMTVLGKLLLRKRDNCLLDVFFHLLGTGELSLDLCCNLLQEEGHTLSTKEQLANNVPFKHFLDGLLLDKVKGLIPDVTRRAMILLVDILVARLTVNTIPPSSSAPFSLYGSRHKWLDSLPPFDGSTKKPFQVVLQDLMQLQALLCTNHSPKNGSHVTSVQDHMTKVAQHLEEQLVVGMVGELSLQLLAWPHTGKMEQAMHLIFQLRPAMTVEYCETFLPPRLPHWNSLLELLLKNCEEPEGQQKSLPHTNVLLHTYRTLYRAALGHVVGLCSAEEFCSLLPPSGSLSFFLPFIEKSCKLHMSRELAHYLHTPNADTNTNTNTNSNSQ